MVQFVMEGNLLQSRVIESDGSYVVILIVTKRILGECTHLLLVIFFFQLHNSTYCQPCLTFLFSIYIFTF